MIRLVPNSDGFPERDLVEFNPCHSHLTGRFCSDPELADSDAYKLGTAVATAIKVHGSDWLTHLWRYSTGSPPKQAPVTRKKRS